ncbi:hypothetical protein [Streptomyces aureus]|uniref:Uncharacterized protein n=1 Tax=Streptomyces aureus TaxID=193461 RepID=A0ABV4SL66_9ACTN
MRRRLREATTRETEPQGKLDALATVTAHLYYENLGLQKKASAAPGRVTALPTSGPWKE